MAAVVMAGAAVAGAAITAYGMVRQGQYQKAASEYNAQVAERDAQATEIKTDVDTASMANDLRI